MEYLIVCPLCMLAGFVDAVAGNWLGARCFTEKGARVVRPIMLTVITLFALKLIVDIGRGLGG